MAERPIDQKIVVMKLDNSDFKQKAAETTTIFGRIRDVLSRLPSINLGKTTQQVASIAHGASDSVGAINNMGNSVQTVIGRFSNMGVVATTVLATITSKATQAGMSLAKSLTVDQVSGGFREYETKIGAIGTMLSNTEWAGTNLDDVKKTLGELNDYADNTIYSFEQMTENIGRFTAAGVTLENSAIAIKGLGNLAAASGSNVEQLNSAMYQSSQALASGKLNLEDWNSLVNAGMAGKKTQDALVETAKAMGKNVDLSQGFRNSIQKGWLTSEVFLETLKKFGADDSMTKAATSVRTFTGMISSLKEGIGSGWAETWELVFGDFEEATTFWTDMSDSIGGWFKKTTEARNNLLRSINERGGIVDIFSGIQNAVKPVAQLFGALRSGFVSVFPPKSVDQIISITSSFREFTKGLQLGSDTVQKITTIFQGGFAVISTVIEIVKRLGSAFMNLIPPGAGGGLLDILEKLAILSIRFNWSVKEGNGLTAMIDGLGIVFAALGKGISSTLGFLGGLGGLLMGGLGKTIGYISDKLVQFGGFLKDTFSDVGGAELAGSGVLATLVMFGTQLFGLFDNFGDIVDGITDTFEGIGDAVNNFAMGVKIVNLVLIAIALGILAASLKTLENIKTEDITKGIIGLSIALGAMILGMMLMDKFKVTGGLKASATLIALATAVLIVTSALKKISDLKPEELRQGIRGLIGIVAALSIGIIAISKFGGKVKVGSMQLIALAGAVYILVSAVKTMSDIETGSLFKSIGALTLIFAQLAIFIKVVDKSKLSVGSALAVIAIAGAIHLMILAIKGIDSIDVNGLIKGLTTITIILAQIAIFTKLIKGSNLAVAGVGLLLIATALTALIIPIKELGKMSMDELAKGLGAMAIALLVVSGAAKLMNGSIGGAIAIAIMAGALNLLYIPIRNFASMSWSEIIRGFVGIGGGLLLVAGAALLLSPAVVPMLGFAAALLAIGIAVLTVGAGVGLFAIGLATLATLTATSVAAIVGALALLLQGIGSLIPAAVEFLVNLGLALINGLTALIPPLVNLIIVLVNTLLTKLTTYLPRFISMGTTLILQLLDGMGKAIPVILDGAVKFIINLINGMSQTVRENGPILESAIMDLMGEIIILMVQTGADVIGALFGWIPGVQGAMQSVSDSAEQSIRDAFGAREVGASKGDDFASGLSGTTTAAGIAGTTVGNAGLNGANVVNLGSVGITKGIDFASGLSGTSFAAGSAGTTVGLAGQTGASGADLGSVGITKGVDFASGLGSQTGLSNSSGVNLANSGKDGATSVSLNSAGSDFAQGFANGISSGEGGVWAAAKGLASRAVEAVRNWLDINSPSRVMMKVGGSFGEGFATGITDETKRVNNSAKGLAMTANDSINQFLERFEIPTEDNELHFKAVIDYDSLDPSKFGNPRPVRVIPDTSFTNSSINATNAIRRQNDDINLTKVSDDERTRLLLSEINDNIQRINPNKPVYLVVNDKVLGQSVTKNVVDNYDMKYIKAERGLANA